MSCCVEVLRVFQAAPAFGALVFTYTDLALKAELSSKTNQELILFFVLIISSCLYHPVTYRVR